MSNYVPASFLESLLNSVGLLPSLVSWVMCHCAIVPSLCHRAIMSRTSFRVNLHSIVCLNVKELLARSRRHIWSLTDSNVIRTHNHLVRNRTLNHLAKPAKRLCCVVSTYLCGAFDRMLSYVTYEFQSESTLYSFPECTHTTTQSFGQFG